MTSPMFVDVSSFQPQNIDWAAYRKWAASVDGIARVAMRSSYGVGFKDQHFDAYRQGALSAGVDMILFYHYGYPQYNSPTQEANWQKQVVGAIRNADMLALDIEENVTQATGDWVYQWASQQQANYGGKVPRIYAYEAFIQQHLQDQRLANFPLWYALWSYDPNARPLAPAPWTSYEALQYTDKATNIPGIPGTVDADIFLVSQGGPSMAIPTGWKDDGTTLTAPNGFPVVAGFREHVLVNNWSPDNYPLEVEHGQSPLELSNPSLGDGTQQVFRWTVLEWTQARGVFEAWGGQELLALRNLIATLQSGALKTDVENLTALVQPTVTAWQAALVKIRQDAGLPAS